MYTIEEAADAVLLLQERNKLPLRIEHLARLLGGVPIAVFIDLATEFNSRGLVLLTNDELTAIHDVIEMPGKD